MSAPRHARARAFTLVEIAVAIALLAFCLAGIIGLVGVATNANRDTDRDTHLVSMSTLILDDLRSLPFDLLGFAVPRDHLTDSAFKTSPANRPIDSSYYFTVDGTPVAVAAGGAPPASAIYLCTVHKTPDEATRSYASNGGAGDVNLLELELRYEWPLVAPAGHRQTKGVHASIARY